MYSTHIGTAVVLARSMYYYYILRQLLKIDFFCSVKSQCRGWQADNHPASQIDSDQIDGIISFDSSLAFNIWPFSHQYAFIVAVVQRTESQPHATETQTKMSFIAYQPTVMVKGRNSYKIKLQTTFLAAMLDSSALHSSYQWPFP